MAAAAVFPSTLTVGQPLPSAGVVILDKGARKVVQLDTLYDKTKPLAIFTMPGAFTPTCEGTHFKSIKIEQYRALKCEVLIVTTDNIHALEKWKQSVLDLQLELVVPGLKMVSDYQHEFGKATGLISEPLPAMPTCLKRSSVVVIDGKVLHMNVEAAAKNCDASKGDKTLAQVEAAAKTQAAAAAIVANK